MNFTNTQKKQINRMFDELQEMATDILEISDGEFNQLFKKNVKAASGSTEGGQLEIMNQFMISARTKTSYNPSNGLYYNELMQISELCDWAQQSRLLAWRFDLVTLKKFKRHEELVHELFEIYMTPCETF